MINKSNQYHIEIVLQCIKSHEIIFTLLKQTCIENVFLIALWYSFPLDLSMLTGTADD